MRRLSRNVLMGRLGPWERVRFGLAFVRQRRRLSRLDLSSLRARGMTNETFLKTQLEYLAMFAALQETVGEEKAVRLAEVVMEASAREPMRLTLPDPEEVRRLGDPFTVFRHYFRAAPEAARLSGCNTITIPEDTDEAFQFNVHTCVWLDLARLAGVPAACRANCYSDDLVFPEYFSSLGVRYHRLGTLARGAPCCDFRFERRGGNP